jgi:hypothetical protein
MAVSKRSRFAVQRRFRYNGRLLSFLLEQVEHVGIGREGLAHAVPAAISPSALLWVGEIV